MPGIVVFKRRWSVGSDDLVVPAVFMVILHIIWIIVLGVILGVVDFDQSEICTEKLKIHCLGYLGILSGCALLEGIISWVAMRGSILVTDARDSMQYLLYTRLGLFIVEMVWQILGVVWVAQHYDSCTAALAKRAVLGVIVCNWAVMLSVLISLWCTFDTAGRSWVKMKRFQESVREREHRQGQKRRSGSRRRNWRNRKAMRAYEQSWDRRCQFLFCCVKEDRHRNSFTEVAKLFTEFFRDLDVVPSDVVAGLVLLRNHQKSRRKYIVSLGTNEVYQFLSGVPITPSTCFLSLKQPDVMADYKNVLHYMRYALAAYGWPMYMMMNTGTGLCKIMPYLRCCCCMACRRKSEHMVLVEDNCCYCNYAALRKLSGLKELDMVYVTYHVDIGETPFFIAVDHEKKKVVISIRGTLSLQDVLTDLKADAEPLPLDPPKEDWLGHKGMVQAALYIKNKINNDRLLAQAFGRDLERGTQKYDLVLVGHSLGAGTATILAILLHQEYPNLVCYAYSPPGGLLTATCVEETKHFITSVVVGKDVVPRIGLHQLEALRQDLITVIKKSTEPKWKIIAGLMCCCPEKEEATTEMMTEGLVTDQEMQQDKDSRYYIHPSDSQIALTTHTPLFLPGKIIHIVRNHPKGSGKLCGRMDPVYQAIWADNKDFGEVLISPTMVNDHMPDHVMDALEKVLTHVSPAKPTRRLPESERKALLSDSMEAHCLDCGQEAAHQECQETSFSHLEESEEIHQLNGVRLGSDRSLSWEYPPGGVDPSNTETGPPQEPVEEESSPIKCPVQKPTDLPLLRKAAQPIPTHAPLASPETLSDTSSMCSSVSSKRYSNGYQKLTASVSVMEPIQQSPMRAARSESYCYFVDPPSPLDYAEIVGRDLVSARNSCPPNMLGSLGDMDSEGHTIDSDSDLVDIHISDHKAQTDSVRNEPFQLDFEDETSEDLGDYVRHSPETPDSAMKPVVYDLYQGHYSPAGRGYPHGSYMSDLEICATLSEGEKQPDHEEMLHNRLNPSSENLLTTMGTSVNECVLSNERDSDDSRRLEIDNCDLELPPKDTVHFVEEGQFEDYREKCEIFDQLEGVNCEHPYDSVEVDGVHDSLEALLPRTREVVFVEASSSDSDNSGMMGNHVSSSIDSDRPDNYMHNIIHETTTSEYV